MSMHQSHSTGSPTSDGPSGRPATQTASKPYDLVALGESLIDFTPSGANEMGMPLYACNPGGAPANVLAMYARLGGRTAFIGKVGADYFGAFLRERMEQAHIGLEGLVTSREAHTTLAFVQLDQRGDRSFSFYRKPGADLLLRAEEIPQELLSGCKIFHFGSVSMTDEPSRSATFDAARKAKRLGAWISFDPNYRPLLWENEALARQVIGEALPLADLIKVSREEMELLSGRTDLRAGSEWLMQTGSALVVVVTLGGEGAYYLTRTASGLLPAYQVDTVDTTGAGDAFVGALLHQISRYSRSGLERLGRPEWEEMVAFANAAGSLTTTGKGAIPAMPDPEAIRRLMGR